MERHTVSGKVLRASEAFVMINGEDFFVGDWLKNTDCRGNGRPWVIVTTYQDAGEQGIVLRDGEFKKQLYTIEEFTKMIRAGKFYRLEKPKFSIGQTFRNCYTEKVIRIIEVPFAPNDRDGEYIYFIFSKTPTYGQNFESVTEQELCDLYTTEGIEVK